MSKVPLPKRSILNDIPRFAAISSLGLYDDEDETFPLYILKKLSQIVIGEFISLEK